MKLIHTLTVASAVLGLAGTSMAGTSAAAPASCSPDAFNQWNVEASLLHFRGRAESWDSQDFENGYRLGVSYQASPEEKGYRATYTEFKGSNNVGTEWGVDYTSINLEVFKNGLSLGPIDYSYSYGLRYLDMVEDYSSGRDLDYRGFGPVAGLDVSYALPYNFSLYGNAEVSWIFGHDKEGNASDDDYTFTFAAGVRYDIPCTMVDGAYVKVGYEVEHLNRLTYSNSAKIQGYVFSVGYDF